MKEELMRLRISLSYQNKTTATDKVVLYSTGKEYLLYFKGAKKFAISDKKGSLQEIVEDAIAKEIIPDAILIEGVKINSVERLSDKKYEEQVEGPMRGLAYSKREHDRLMKQFDIIIDKYI